MQQKIDAVVLAGNKDASRNFAKRNKNFLKVGGQPILAHVLNALDKVARVRRIFVVGPEAEIADLLASRKAGWQTKVCVMEQKETLLDNAWGAFIESLGEGYREGDEDKSPALQDHAALFLGGDLPLVSSEEINEFLDGCFSKDLDYGAGMTEEAHLNRFYPKDGKPGIEMSYLHLANGSFRLNNLHFVRPFRIGNRTYMQRAYRARYQKQVFNIIRIMKDIFTTPGLGLKPVMIYLMLQCCTLCQALRLRWLLRFIRRHITEEQVTNVANKMLDAHTAVIPTTVGGAAIDVDNEKDLKTINTRYDEFAKLPAKPSPSPSSSPSASAGSSASQQASKPASQ